MFCLPWPGYKKRCVDAEHRVFSLEAMIMLKDSQLEEQQKALDSARLKLIEQQVALVNARLKLAAQKEEIKHKQRRLDMYERPLDFSGRRDKPASLQP